MRAATRFGWAALALACLLAACAATPKRTTTDTGPDAGSPGGDAAKDAGDAEGSGGSTGAACAAPCAADLTCCNGACVDLRNDAAHCGSCATACDPAATAMSVCAAGRCGAVDWALWPMPNGRDDVSGGAPNPIRLSDNLDGSVSDLVTHLLWQQHVPTTGGASDDGYLTWAEAYAYCGALSAAGHTDWRLPSQIELVSLVDYSNFGPDHAPIDTAIFPDTPADAFWSSTRHAGSQTEAWTVYMDVGFTYAYEMTTVGRVRCVR